MAPRTVSPKQKPRPSNGAAAAISGYLGHGATFDLAIAAFAGAYANQNQRDFERLTAAWKANEITVQTGV